MADLYNTFSTAGPDDDSEKTKADAIPKRINPDVQIVKKTITVLPGEGPTQVAKRISESMGGAPVSWADIVQQNLRYFKNVKNISDINSKSFNSNRDLRPGMLVHYQAMIFVAPKQAKSSLINPVVISYPAGDDSFKFGADGNLSTLGSIEFIFGVENDNLQALIGVGVEVYAGGEFLLDKDGVSGTTKGPKVGIFAEGEFGFDLGAVEWGGRLKGEFDPSTKDFTIEFDRTLNWAFEDDAGPLFSKRPHKGEKVKKTLVSSFGFNYFQFEYDIKTRTTKIGVSIELSDEFEGTVPLGNPLIKIKIKTGGSGKVNFYIEIPGDQRHLKPREIQRVVQPLLSVPNNQF